MSETGGSARPPKIYNPIVCIVLTLLFSPIFGAFLHGLNWRELGKHDLAARNMTWVRWSFYTFVIYTFSEPFIRETLIGRYLMIALFVGLWASWTLSLGLRQAKYVREYVGSRREPQRFGRAVMLGAFGWVAYTAVALTLVLALHVLGIEPLPADAPILQKP